MAVNRVREQVQSMIDQMVASIPNLIVAILVLALFILIARVAKNFAIRAGKRHRKSANLGQIIGRLIEWVIVLAGILVAVSVVAPSFQTKDLVNMLGIGGLAVGFAFRDIFQNFLAGIILLLTHPFEIGDQIAAGAYEGTVEAIETRATTIRTYDGRRVVIPNATLFAEPVSVNTAFGRLQSQFELQVAASYEVKRLQDAIRDTVESVPGVLGDPAPEVQLSGLADDKFTLVVRWWTAPQHKESLDVRALVLGRIKEELASLRPVPATSGR